MYLVPNLGKIDVPGGGRHVDFWKIDVPSGDGYIEFWKLDVPGKDRQIDSWKKGFAAVWKHASMRTLWGTMKIMLSSGFRITVPGSFDTLILLELWVEALILKKCFNPTFQKDQCIKAPLAHWSWNLKSTSFSMYLIGKRMDTYDYVYLCLFLKFLALKGLQFLPPKVCGFHHHGCLELGGTNKGDTEFNFSPFSQRSTNFFF